MKRDDIFRNYKLKDNKDYMGVGIIRLYKHYSKLHLERIPFNYVEIGIELLMDILGIYELVIVAQEAGESKRMSWLFVSMCLTWFLGNVIDAVFVIWYYFASKNERESSRASSLELLRTTVDDMPMTVLTMWFVLEEYLAREEQKVDLQYFLIFGF